MNRKTAIHCHDGVHISRGILHLLLHPRHTWPSRQHLLQVIGPSVLCRIMRSRVLDAELTARGAFGGFRRRICQMIPDVSLMDDLADIPCSLTAYIRCIQQTITATRFYLIPFANSKLWMHSVMLSCVMLRTVEVLRIAIVLIIFDLCFVCVLAQTTNDFK